MCHFLAHPVEFPVLDVRCIVELRYLIRVTVSVRVMVRVSVSV